VGWLKRWLLPTKFRPEHAKDWKGNIDGTHGEHDDVANFFHVRNMLRGNTQNWRDLFPAEASVGHKDANAKDVKESPNIARTVEELILELINVAYRHSWHASVPGPEKFQFGDAIATDQQRWWTEEVLVGVTEAELEQVDGHESQKHHSRDCKFHLLESFAFFASNPSVGNRFPLVPSALEPDEDMKKGTQSNVFFNNIRREAKASPIEPHIEITIPIEVVWSCKNMKVTHSVNHDEKDEQNG